MKKQLFLFFLACSVISGCRSSHPDKIIVQGKADIPNTHKIYFHSNQGEQEVKPDTLSHTYSLELGNSAQGFIAIQGVVEDNDGPWPFSQDLYLQAGTTVQLDLQAGKRKMNFSVGSKDKNNSALAAYNRFSLQHLYDLWSDTPPAAQAKEFLQKYIDRAHEIVTNTRLKEPVKRYLNIRSYLDYLKGIENFAFIYREDAGNKLPDNLTETLPAPETILNDSIALLFEEDLQQIIYRYLSKQSARPEDQLGLLEEKFTLPAIRQSMATYILEAYVQSYPYAQDFENGLARLKRMCASLPDQGETFIRNFEAKRHIIPGSPLPDATLQTPEGKTCKLSDLKGTALYIDLWASWCVPCCKEVPNLQKLEKEMKNKNIKFVSISIDTDLKAWKERMQQLNMEGNQYIIVGPELPNMLNIQSIPHFLIYDRKGNLVQYKAPRPSQGEEVKRMLKGV